MVRGKVSMVICVSLPLSPSRPLEWEDTMESSTEEYIGWIPRKHNMKREINTPHPRWCSYVYTNITVLRWLTPPPHPSIFNLAGRHPKTLLLTRVLGGQLHMMEVCMLVSNGS